MIRSRFGHCGRMVVAACFAFVSPLGAEGTWAESIKQVFQVAELVVVGSVREITALPRDELFRSAPPFGALEGAEEELFPCLYTLDVRYVIKGAPTTTANELNVLWWVYWRDCKLPRGTWDSALARGDTLIWLLRTEDGRVRLLHDNFDAIKELYGFPPGTAERAERFSDPVLKLSYLLLAPGVGVAKQQDYANEAFAGAERSVKRLAGKFGWQTVMRQLYTEADEELRDEICVLLSAAGACLDCARRAAARGVGRGEYFEARYPYLDKAKFRRYEETTLRALGPYIDSIRKKREAGESLDWDKDVLIDYACGSSAELRRRARSVLPELFGLSSSDLPCVPCEGPE